MKREQLYSAAGTVNTNFDTGVLRGGGVDAALILCSAAGAAMVFNLFAVLDNDSEVQVATINVGLGASSPDLSIGQGCKVNVPLPKRFKVKAPAVVGGTASVAIHSQAAYT